MSSKPSLTVASAGAQGIAPMEQGAPSGDREWGSGDIALMEAALRACGDAVSLEIMEILASGSESKRLQAIKTLRRLCSAQEPFIQALRDKEAEVRCEAIAALSNLGRKSFLPFFVEALQDTDPQVRAAAANALGRLGEPEAKAPLGNALRDEHLHVQTMAAWAIRQLRAGIE